jgi:glycosyltransferase involved in cell wall biosynthesis
MLSETTIISMRSLVVIQGGVGAKVTGPEIRGWAVARGLAEHHDVTVAVDDPSEGVRDGLALISNRRRELIRAARHHDAVVATALPPYLLAALRNSGTVTVSDQYDPVWLETAVLTQDPATVRLLRAQRLMRGAQVRFADVIAVASQAQRTLLMDELDALGGTRGAAPHVVTVPFGVPEPPPATERRPLREAFPAIAADDPVVLWWGKVWRWFDADSAIRAFAQVVDRCPRARLVISAGKSPTAAFDASDHTEAARQLTRELGLLDRNVFFLDEWTPYDRRHEYLMEADIGLTLHANTPEAPFAARARYMDYLWAALPCVLGTGDETAAAFAETGFASLVEPADVDGAAAALLALIQDRSARERAHAAGLRLADRYRWSAIMEGLAHAIDEAHAHPARKARSRMLRMAGSYYVRRTADHATALVRPTAS